MPEELAPAAAETPETPGLDVESTVQDIAESLQLVEAPEEPEDKGEEPPEEPAEAPATEPVSTAAPVAPEPITTDDPAPNTWRKEAKEAWTTVPPLVKEEIRKREQDVMNYVEATKSPAAVGKAFEAVIAPHMDMYQQTKMDPYQHVAGLVQAHRTLLFGSPEQKMGLIHQLAKDAGLTLEGGTLAAPADAAAQHIAKLEQRLAQLEGGVSTVTSTIHNARSIELEGEILKFANDPANPFFSQVADQIPQLISTGAAKDLREAYDLAVMRNPVTRQSAIDAAVAAKVKAAADADAEKLKAARKATGAKVRSTTRERAARPLGNLDDTLKETLAEIHARDN